MQVVSEEQYLEQRGAGLCAMGEPALHRQPGSTPKSRDKAAKRQWLRDGELIELRAKLRREYHAKLAAGELRPPTRLERLRVTAAGHPDRDDVQAARRILGRMGESF